MKTQTQIVPHFIYWASFNRFNVRLTGTAVMDIAQSGQNDDACELWASHMILEKDLLGNVQATPDNIRAELKEYGAWSDEELMDDAQNLVRLVWVAAWNIAEQDCPDHSDPLVPSGETGPFRNLGI